MIGSKVRTVQPVRLRATPGYVGKPESDVLTTLPADERGQVLGGPADLDGLRWWHMMVSASSTTGGWIGWAAATAPNEVALLSFEEPALLPPGWERAVAFVLRLEGGYVNDPNDPGGETKYGISKRSYPQLDIANLTEADAKAIYARDYWQASGADGLPWPLSLIHFDSAVNTGVGQAQKWLQQSGGEASRYLALRLMFYTKLDHWRHFGAAWSRRVADLLQEMAA